MTRFIRVGAWLAVLLTIVLSVVPGSLRPHVLGNEYFEHFAAYCITGGLLAIVCSRRWQLLASGIVLAIGAGALEFVQAWIPGRTASPRDFAASAFGIVVGLSLAGAARWAKHRTAAVSAPK